MQPKHRILAGIIALVVLIGFGPAADARDRSSSGGSRSSSSTYHAPRAARAPRAAKSPQAKPTRFVKATCKSAACKAKHPTGEYMRPIRPKKNSG